MLTLAVLPCGHASIKNAWGRCKECARLAAAAWYRNNKSRASTGAKKRYLLRKDELRAKRMADPLYKKKMLDHRKKYGDARRAARREWYAKNKSRSKAAAAEYRKKNPEKNRLWIGARRARLLGSMRDSSVSVMWKSIVSAYSGRCAYCGNEYKHMDHVIPLSRGGGHVASNVRPACAKCNLSKGTKTWTPRPWAAALPSEAI